MRLAQERAWNAESNESVEKCKKTRESSVPPDCARSQRDEAIVGRTFSLYGERSVAVKETFT